MYTTLPDPSTPSLSTSLDFALSLHPQQWRYHPVGRPGDVEDPGWKKPPLGCRWAHDATADRAALAELGRRWPGCPNLLIATGPGSDLIVIDVPKDDASWLAYAEAHGISLHTFTVATPSGGKHYYFGIDATTPDHGNGTGDLPAGVDVRGRGGYVVAPGSTRPDGKLYACCHGAPVRLIPPELLHALRGNGSRRSAPTPIAPANLDCYAAGALASAVAIIKGTSEADHNRNDTLYAQSAAMGEFVGAGELDENLVIAALTDAARRVNLPEAETAATLRSGLDKGRRTPRRRPPPPVSPRPTAAPPPAAPPAPAPAPRRCLALIAQRRATRRRQTATEAEAERQRQRDADQEAEKRRRERATEAEIQRLRQRDADRETEMRRRERDAEATIAAAFARLDHLETKDAETARYVDALEEERERWQQRWQQQRFLLRRADLPAGRRLALLGLADKAAFECRRLPSRFGPADITVSAADLATSTVGLSEETVRDAFKDCEAAGIFTRRSEPWQARDGRRGDLTVLTPAIPSGDPADWLAQFCALPERTQTRTAADGSTVETAKAGRGPSRRCPECGNTRRFCVATSTTTAIVCADCKNSIGKHTELTHKTVDAEQLPAVAALIFASTSTSPSPSPGTDPMFSGRSKETFDTDPMFSGRSIEPALSASTDPKTSGRSTDPEKPALGTTTYPDPKTSGRSPVPKDELLIALVAEAGAMPPWPGSPLDLAAGGG